MHPIPSIHGLIVTSDYSQSTKLATSAHFYSCVIPVYFCNMPMATMIATGCDCRRHEPHAGA